MVSKAGVPAVWPGNHASTGTSPVVGKAGVPAVWPGNHASTGTSPVVGFQTAAVGLTTDRARG